MCNNLYLCCSRSRLIKKIRGLELENEGLARKIEYHVELNKRLASKCSRLEARLFFNQVKYDTAVKELEAIPSTLRGRRPLSAPGYFDFGDNTKTSNSEIETPDTSQSEEPVYALVIPKRKREGGMCTLPPAPLATGETGGSDREMGR